MLTQAEADALIAMRKSFASPMMISLPPGADQTHELIGTDERERFLLDLWRGTIHFPKLKFQTRARRIIVLVRLDIDGAPHTNPDGARLGGTHLHLYREGYEDKWAYPLNTNEFSDPGNIRQTLEDFCNFCHIEEVPPFQESLL
jgi:hypothetical protein